MNNKFQSFIFPQHNNAPIQPFDNPVFRGFTSFKKLSTFFANGLFDNSPSPAFIQKTTISGTASNQILFTTGINTAGIQWDGAHAINFVNGAGGAQGFNFAGVVTVTNGLVVTQGFTQSTLGMNLIISAAAAAFSVNSNGGGQDELPVGTLTKTRTIIAQGNGLSSILAANENYAALLVGGPTGGVTEATSGTHALLCNVGLKIMTLADGVATTTNTANLYVEGPPTGITPTGENYTVWSDAGVNRFDGVLELGVSVSAAGTLTLDGTANTWIANGTTTTWTLPAISGKTGWSYHLKNKGSGAITLNSNAGGNDIYNTSAVSTISITAGQGCMLVNDGTNWTVISLA